MGLNCIAIWETIFLSNNISFLYINIKTFFFGFAQSLAFFFLHTRSIFKKKKKKIRINFDDDFHHVDLSFFFLFYFSYRLPFFFK
ncbi:hypothetical protein GLOIN_2v412393 [Rhizophagus irregularis DAOM 181602=DAOM 197198]|uniref:Uncharacterized protein n=1 Tax=Rhizophagus irregularis (strain DAOM 181602 / DAOM 197198 / MUCL 43194) TaxID=747089 RepID=A0A2P4PJX2_RHIID|nr:hypothetical protein GLOIN_2v412393 [Rhizophagus irregularis DAOM 181602=DAOM 197198]POG65670.1 hypothetical protein GLOIN_2v412393 [Rhizophagus irregularis DAOM 181602=DAOM 197198]|eukprot:XP_025172536.1 hypothetical protein GLOIN_2v412393 [Rhizophagus irregularis DAOM 181602=DAOM 197198]